VEPNNSRTAAQALALPVTVNGTMASTTDTDYYRVTVAAGQRITVRLTPNTASDYDLSAYNASGVRIASSVLGTGAVDSVTLTNSSTTSAATAYLRVIYYAGRTGSTGTYTLSVQ
jgi:serine protease